MNYLDILENLGISKDNRERIEGFYTHIENILILCKKEPLPVDTVFSVCQKIGFPLARLIGIRPNDIMPNEEEFLKKILFSSAGLIVEFHECLARISILLCDKYFIENELLKTEVANALEYWKLPYVLCDNIIIPKGADELDKALVFSVAVWLNKYPVAQKSFTQALQQYYDNDPPRDIADNLRKSFEDFLKEFFGNKKNLDKNINVVGTYLKDNGINEEIRCMFTTLISHYKTLNDKTAKHHDDTNKNSIEFLLYQTGVFMRCLIIINENKTEETAEE